MSKPTDKRHIALWRLLQAASKVAPGMDRFDETRLLSAAIQFATEYGPPDIEHGRLVEMYKGYEIRLWAETYYGVVVGDIVSYNRPTLEAARYEVRLLT